VAALCIRAAAPITPTRRARFRRILLVFLKPTGGDADGCPMASPVAYDPHVIEQFAASLYRKAGAARRGSTVFGVVLGGAFGAIPLTSLGDAWPIPSSFGYATLLVGLIAGGLIGHVIGDARAFGYKLQAQAALCQVEIQRNTQTQVHATLVQAAASSPPPPTLVAAAGNGDPTARA
jgi:hypothetical protein